MLYSYDDATFLLGALMNDPKLLESGKYTLNREDFKPFRFHQILFVCIENLTYNQGVTEIDEILIDKYAEPYKEQYKVLQDNNFIEVIPTLKKLAKSSTINFYYDSVRKFSLLRFYKQSGYNIIKFYDESKDEINQRENLNGYNLKDIVNYYEGINLTANKTYINENISEEMWGGDGWDSVLDSFETSPMIGATLPSYMLNSVFRGWVKGHFILLGSPSGKGKTTMAIASLCNVCCTHLWNNDTGKYEINPHREGNGFYIHTEQKTEKEIQPRFISTISQIPYHKILDGKYTLEEKKRLSDAGKIFRASKMKLINMPDFTISKLEFTIKDMVLNHDMEFGVMDYLWNNFTAMGELRDKTGATFIREDQILLKLGDCIKVVGEQYGCAMMSMIQLNGNEKTNEIVDESCLFGTKQIKSKLDCGYILLPPRKKEQQIAQDILIPKYNQSKGYNDDITNPNRLVLSGINTILHVFKGRYSKYGSNVKIWGHLDYSTGAFIDYFATDTDNFLVNIEKIEIVVDK